MKKYAESAVCSPRKRRGGMKSLTEINSDIAECAKHRQLAATIGRIVNKFAPALGVTVHEWKIQEMKMYWASVNTREGKITFNLKLLDMPPAFIKATVIHELVHFLTDGHDAKFHELMDRHAPGWRKLHDQFAEEMTQYS